MNSKIYVPILKEKTFTEKIYGKISVSNSQNFYGNDVEGPYWQYDDSFKSIDSTYSWVKSPVTKDSYTSLCGMYFYAYNVPSYVYLDGISYSEEKYDWLWFSYLDAKNVSRNKSNWRTYVSGNKKLTSYDYYIDTIGPHHIYIGYHKDSSNGLNGDTCYWTYNRTPADNFKDIKILKNVKSVYKGSKKILQVQDDKSNIYLKDESLQNSITLSYWTIKNWSTQTQPSWEIHDRDNIYAPVNKEMSYNWCGNNGVMKWSIRCFGNPSNTDYYSKQNVSSYIFYQKNDDDFFDFDTKLILASRFKYSTNAIFVITPDIIKITYHGKLKEENKQLLMKCFNFAYGLSEVHLSYIDVSDVSNKGLFYTLVSRGSNTSSFNTYIKAVYINGWNLSSTVDANSMFNIKNSRVIIDNIWAYNCNETTINALKIAKESGNFTGNLHY